MAGDFDDETNVQGQVQEPKIVRRDRAFLIVLAGQRFGEMFRIGEGEMIVGRGREAQIRFEDDGMSRAHAKIVSDGDRVEIVDLESRNGTFCNGERIDRMALADGDKLQLGSTTILKFSFHDQFDESFQRGMLDSALRDGLTRLFNRQYFQERLTNEVAFAKRHGAAVSLQMLDLDNFKQLNDDHGHPAGDSVLQGLAGILEREARQEDVVARYGGEEFVILSRGGSRESMVAAGERIRRAVEAEKFDVGYKMVSVTVSVGVAVFSQDIHEPGDLIARADGALYEAKRQGRNRVVVA
jgi:diguanylate cyclase (GGDEF)-like protein